MRRPPLLVQLLFCGAISLFIYSTTSPIAKPQGPTLHSQTASAANFVAAPQPSSSDGVFWLPPLDGVRAAKTVSGCAPAPGPKQRKLEAVPLTPCQSTDETACALASNAPERSLLVLSLDASAVSDKKRTQRLMAARDAVAPGQLIVIVVDANAAQHLQSIGVGWWRLPSTTSPLVAQWRAAALLLRAGCSVVVGGSRIKWNGSPFSHLYNDVDVQAAQDNGGQREQRGNVIGVHDPPMGWSAYGQTMTVPLLLPDLVALQPTLPSAELASQMAYRIQSRLSSADGDTYSMLLTRLIHSPAHDGESRAGVSMRVLRGSCFTSESTSVLSKMSLSSPVSQVDSTSTLTAEEVLLTDTKEPAGTQKLKEYNLPERGPGSNDILTSIRQEGAKELVLTHGCRARPRDEGSPIPRPLNELIQTKDESFPRKEACKADENMVALCALLAKAAINREVLAAVSNKNIHAMLGTFIVGTRRANISNALIVALDDPTAAFARKKGIHTYVRKLVSRTGSTDNHATSGLKFAILHEFISAGCAVLLSDVDVVWLQNPFTLPSLYRDVDVEGMTDGWDDPTAYGYDWRGNTAFRLSARNSGLFYVRATHETLAMMSRLKRRMETEAVWDQTAYNEEMW